MQNTVNWLLKLRRKKYKINLFYQLNIPRLVSAKGFHISGKLIFLSFQGCFLYVDLFQSNVFFFNTLFQPFDISNQRFIFTLYFMLKQYFFSILAQK